LQNELSSLIANSTWQSH